jgi:putative acetyltransferase
MKSIQINEYTNFLNPEPIQELFREYIHELGIDASFQNFELELEVLSRYYSKNAGGVLLIAKNDDQIIGCVALRKIDEHACEMKRLYVRPIYRKTGVGRALCQQLIDTAISFGYQKMKLDVLISSNNAINLYEELGFKRTTPYCFNPYPAV